MAKILRLAILLWAVAWWGACDAEKAPAADSFADLGGAGEGGVVLEAGAKEAGADIGPGGGTIAIYLAGDLTPKAFNDGLASQTPGDYQIALSKYFLQTSLDDANAVLCFDHGNEPVIADLHRPDTLMGKCSTSTVPTTTYTHGRVKVDWVRYSVKATVHYIVPNPGKLTFFRAYSNTTYKGKAYKAGEGSATFSGAVNVTIPLSFDQVPKLPGIKLETIKGEFWMTFPYLRPLPVDRNNKRQEWARFYWEIDQGFRWKDRATAGYAKGVWDVSATGGQSEDVLRSGVTGYHITSSIDK